MRIILTLLFLTYGCSQLPPRAAPEEVSLDAALNQAQMSFLKGCVGSFQELGIAPSFARCRDKALDHRRELEQILDWIPPEARSP